MYVRNIVKSYIFIVSQIVYSIHAHVGERNLITFVDIRDWNLSVFSSSSTTVTFVWLRASRKLEVMSSSPPFTVDVGDPLSNLSRYNIFKELIIRTPVFPR